MVKTAMVSQIGIIMMIQDHYHQVDDHPFTPNTKRVYDGPLSEKERNNKHSQPQIKRGSMIQSMIIAHLSFGAFVRNKNNEQTEHLGVLLGIGGRHYLHMAGPLNVLLLESNQAPHLHRPLRGQEEP